MKVDKIIRLTFADGYKRPARKGDRTISKLTSYFKQENLDKVFNQLGFTTLPTPVLDILKKYGYTYDYKLGGWKTTTTGIVRLQPGDVDIQEKANNMATTKAKVKAFDRASRCMKEIYDVFFNTVKVLACSLDDLTHITEDETAALLRCLKTGYCNPNKK